MAAQQTASAAADAVQAVTDGVKGLSTSEGQSPAANLLLDEVTGERVSKTELKKRQKQREKERQKAEREATRQPPPAPKRRVAGGAAAEEEELNPNVGHLLCVRRC